jgi:hypothetical protein
MVLVRMVSKSAARSSGVLTRWEIWDRAGDEQMRRMHNICGIRKRFMVLTAEIRITNLTTDDTDFHGLKKEENCDFFFH